MMGRLKLFFCCAALALGGCGGPPATLDVTTDASAESSLKAMTAGMTDAEKKRFQEDCDIATLPDQFQTSTPAKGNGPKDKLKSLNGLTADEIRSKAAVLRAKLSQ